MEYSCVYRNFHRYKRESTHYCIDSLKPYYFKVLYPFPIARNIRNIMPGNPIKQSINFANSATTIQFPPKRSLLV